MNHFIRSGLLALLSCQVAWASPEAKLTASDGSASDFLGTAVALSGETAVVGSYLSKVGENNSQGAVYIYVKSGETWTEQQKLTASDGTLADRFGYALAVDGDTLVVGAYGDDDFKGSVYVLVRSGTTWVEQQKLTLATGIAGDLFGAAVGLSGNTLVIGASGQDGYRGSAYVFVRNGNIWSQQQVLTAPDSLSNDSFGQAVAIQGETIAVGAYQGDVNGSISQGAVYVFVRNSTVWSQQQKLTASDGTAGDYFGSAVALSGETLAVGAYRDDNYRGGVYLFDRSGAVWTEQQKLTATDSVGSDNFGESIGLSGNTLAVGAYGDGEAGKRDQGAVYVFVRQDSTWFGQQKLQASDGSKDDYFGSAVALVGDQVLAGASGDDLGSNTNQGSAYVVQTRPVPSINSFSPATSSIGEAVTLTGVNLTGTTAVQVGTAPATFIVDSNTQITLTVPFTARSGIITVTTPLGTGSSAALTIRPYAVRVPGWQLAGAADFNGDEETDLLWRNYTTGANEVWLMNGTNYVATAPLQERKDTRWQLVGAADFNGDAQPDLLWRNDKTGRNSIWQLNGTTFVAETFLTRVSDLTWQLVGAADFTSDGQPDLLWRNYSSGENAVWQMNGTELVTGILLDTVTDPSWQLTGAADFTNDGQTDLLWRNYSSGENAVWQMNGTTLVMGLSLNPVTDLAWQLTGAGNFAGTSQADLLWRNALTGEDYTWELAGTTYLNAFSLGSRPVN
ncbi:FG-GAP-like repeat-containing protein [Candidatus Cyanaurora vandensis]|uniref:FG-GAP-like repeat-containing protein n=1 Tax=Candidatus Cyanaurora vandensis TaxID=2714958 RepID=UPI00257A4C90|nr:FG-GAP-like repeat-containing protein [Candidatus Cyanaurora vandensis]